MKSLIFKIFIFSICLMIIISTHIPISVASDMILKRANHISTNKHSTTVSDIINSINETTVYTYLKTLVNNYPYRVTGSDTCNNAADYISAEFSKMQSSINIERHNWSRIGHIWRPIHHLKLFHGSNIIATIPGVSNDTSTFIFSAHYDCNENSPGALDDGSGIAALLTVTRALSNYSFNHTMKFIAFSGEEQGLLGSYALAQKYYAQDQKIVGVINADVIGNNTLNTTKYNSLRAFGTVPCQWIIDEMQTINQLYNVNLEVKNIGRYFGHSDDKAFDDYGYPVMQLYNSANNLEKIYGKKNDTIDKINISYLTKICKIIAGTLATCLTKSANFLTLKIIEPNENNIYIKNKKILPIFKGQTIVTGDFTLSTLVTQDTNQITHVKFELLKGENEDAPINRPILANWNDSNRPYSWNICNDFSGWVTVRATAYNATNELYADEIEIKLIPIEIFLIIGISTILTTALLIRILQFPIL